MLALTDDEHFMWKERQDIDSTSGTTPMPIPVPVDDFYCIEKTCPGSGKLLTLPWRDCGNRECCTCKTGGSHYPECPTCGKVMRHNVSAPNVIWTGPLTDRYRTKENESYGKGDGMWAWRRKSSISGKPEPVFLNDWQSVRNFAHAEGCADPREISNVMEPTETGKGLKNSVGTPGCEI